MKIPAFIQAGDSLFWTDTPQSIGGTSYTSADYDLTYALRGAAVLDLTAVAEGDGWKTTISTVESAGLIPGAYRWAAYFSKTGKRITAGIGDFKVTPNMMELAAGEDVRTFYQSALAAAEQALADFSSSGGKAKIHRINGQEYEFNNTDQILRIVMYWKSRVNAEQTAEKIAQGQGNPRRLFGVFR